MSPAAPTEAGGGAAARQVARLVGVVEQAVSELAAVERRLGELEERQREPAAGAVEWLDDEELTDRLQAIFARQARRRGIDLS